MSNEEQNAAGSADERRRDQRLERESEVAFDISFLDETMTPVKISCTTLDISKSGLRVKLSHQLPVGFITELCIEDTTRRLMLLFAEVKWCRPSESLFECGFELLDAENSDLAHWAGRVEK